MSDVSFLMCPGARQQTGRNAVGAKGKPPPRYSNQVQGGSSSALLSSQSGTQVCLEHGGVCFLVLPIRIDGKEFGFDVLALD